MDSFIPDHSKKPKESNITLSSYRNARAEPRDNVPIVGAMEGLAVDDAVNEVEHVKKDEKKKKSGDKAATSRSKSPMKESEKEKEKKKDKAKAKEKEEKEKDKAKAKETKVETPKSPPKAKGKKVEKELNVQNGCAPAILVSQVLELGMKPLFENYLSPKLLKFKKHPKFIRGAQFWNLRSVTKTPFDYAFRAEDFECFTADDLLQNFLSEKTDAGAIFRESLSYDEEWMWDCMVDFDTMKKEDTTFGDFMRLLDDTILALEDTIFEKDNPENIQTLKKLFDKYWDRKNWKPKKL